MLEVPILMTYETSALKYSANLSNQFSKYEGPVPPPPFVGVLTF
jgi:hypothetical protein